jgi:hypothetical protein
MDPNDTYSYLILIEISKKNKQRDYFKKKLLKYYKAYTSALW